MHAVALSTHLATMVLKHEFEKMLFNFSKTFIYDGIWTEVSNSLWGIPVLSLIIVNHHQFDCEKTPLEIWAKGKWVDAMDMISN